jgi:predicted choloylglycine hydrolase
LIRLLELSGDHYQIGLQHGRQVHDLRPQLLDAIGTRRMNLERLIVDLQSYRDEIVAFWQEQNCATLEMLRGICEALDFSWEDYLDYTLFSYAVDRTKQEQCSQECTTWAAAGVVTRDGAPILVKNRDYRLNHQFLQCLARVHPSHGYRYICLTSAGSAGVFSSGMNEQGLAVADTHVSSLDVGPGIPRYSAMMKIVETCSRVNEALEYLNSIQHIGDGTLILADAQGDMAVFETGHHFTGQIQTNMGFLVSTNHYISPALQTLWVDRNPIDLRGSTKRRYLKVSDALASQRGRVDIDWAKNLMSEHGDALSALCRHADLDPWSTTLSTIIYLPSEGRLHLSNGLPCEAKFDIWPVV